MSESGRAAQRKVPAAEAEKAAQDVDEAERALGRAVSRGLPVVSIAGAILAGIVSGVGAGLLVLAAGALIGTIAFLWASLRTLTGDSALPADMEALTTRRPVMDELHEQKIRVLRALKDLESEHALGKIDDADYADLVARYREEAKNVLRAIDLEVAPRRAEAERIATEYLRQKSLASAKGVTPGDGAEPEAKRRLACETCATSNEPDATFCKKCGARLSPGPGASHSEKVSDATS
jgi:hypothetical protein